MDKVTALKSLLAELPGAVIAFSGGVDSTFLAAVAHEVLGERCVAVTAVSSTYPERQVAEARDIATQLGLRHEVIQTDEFNCAEFVANPPDRCYYCKLALFSDLRRLADRWDLGAVLDGANADDRCDHRPGHRAARELLVRSPLQEAGLTKAEIRHFSREMGLPTWDKPAYACLASRIPYGRAITPQALARVDQAETLLAVLGFRQCRVRDHYPVARVEVAPDELDLAWRERAAIAARLHEIGYPYVALDLDGFRSGSLNEILPAGARESDKDPVLDKG